MTIWYHTAVVSVQLQGNQTTTLGYNSKLSAHVEYTWCKNQDRQKKLVLAPHLSLWRRVLSGVRSPTLTALDFLLEFLFWPQSALGHQPGGTVKENKIMTCGQAINEVTQSARIFLTFVFFAHSTLKPRLCAMSLMQAISFCVKGAGKGSSFKVAFSLNSLERKQNRLVVKIMVKTRVYRFGTTVNSLLTDTSLKRTRSLSLPYFSRLLHLPPKRTPL